MAKLENIFKRVYSPIGPLKLNKENYKGKNNRLLMKERLTENF